VRARKFSTAHRKARQTPRNFPPRRDPADGEQIWFLDRKNDGGERVWAKIFFDHSLW